MNYGYKGPTSVEYICRTCGSVNSLFDRWFDLKKRYTTCYIYCPVCKRDTDSILLGDSSLVRSELEFVKDLSDIELEVYSLLGLKTGKTR